MSKQARIRTMVSYLQYFVELLSIDYEGIALMKILGVGLEYGRDVMGHDGVERATVSLLYSLPHHTTAHHIIERVGIRAYMRVYTCGGKA